MASSLAVAPPLASAPPSTTTTTTSEEASVPPPAAAASTSTSSSEGIGDLVATHYNNLDEKGLEQRKESRIFHMRNLNNWIKSQLINEYMDKIRQKGGDHRVNVLDIGCGKGGDLLKWSKARVDHIVCCDIAKTSIEQCSDRYYDMRRRQGRHQRLFNAEFHVADCTKANLRDQYKDPDILFDIVSCQFAFHYCFESLPQAECMLRNVSERLKPGGFFIGTTPDASDIVDRVRTAGTGSVGNSVYSISFDEEDLAKTVLEDPSKIPLFGAKYKFHLEGVVDCPEFLVHFPTLVKLAERHGLMMVAKRRFGNYFAQYQEKGLDLLTRMNALETYPPHEGVELVGKDREEVNYAHAKEFLEELEKKKRPDDPRTTRIGTLSAEEWEAAKLYVIFAFKKMSG